MELHYEAEIKVQYFRTKELFQDTHKDVRCIFDIRYMLYANVICSTLVHKKANLYLKSWVMIQSCYCQKSRFIQNIHLCNIKLKLDVRYLSWGIETRSKKDLMEYATIVRFITIYHIEQLVILSCSFACNNTLLSRIIQFIRFAIHK